MRPTVSSERVELLDVLRGVAILGMFTVNMTLDAFYGDRFRESGLALPDFLTVVFVDLFTSGKFITIFSMLFGLGVCLQYERATARGESFVSLHLRRAASLLVIGVGAMALTLPAWILVDYAVLGLALLPFCRCKPRTILFAALICILVSKLFGSVIPDIRETRELTALAVTQGVPVAEVVLPEDPEAAAEDAEEARIFSSGSFAEVSINFLSHLWHAFTRPGYYLDNIDLVGIMLIGLFLGRCGAVRNRVVRLDIARRSLPWLLGLGLAGAFTWVAMVDIGLGDPSGLAHRIIRKLARWPFGTMVLGLGYVAAITLLMERPGWRHRLAPFGDVGRMALSNYLFTTLVGAVVTWQWGLGLYSRIGALQGLLVAVAIFALQVPASRWWMRQFRYGPCEWVWRTMTYGRLPPIRRSPVTATS